MKQQILLLPCGVFCSTYILQYVYFQHKISSYLNCVYARETIDNDLLEFVTQAVRKALWLLRHTAIEVHGLIKYLAGVKFLKAKINS